MRKIVVPSLALVASAALVAAAACSKGSDGPVAPMPVAVPYASAIGPFVAAQVQVCVNPASPPGAYTFTAGPITDAQPGDATHSPTIIDTSVPGATCGVILDRTPGTNGTVATTTVHASTGVAGTFSYVCTNDGNDATCGASTGTNDATAGENAFHGGTLTFLFVPDPPPPSTSAPTFVIGDVEAHDIDSNVNFWGAQWWKHNDMSGAVSKGIAGGSFKGYATTADDFCGGTWTSRVGNSPPPPASIGNTINIIVTSSMHKSGPDISGNILQILTIDVGPGYGSNPGHAGNGVVTRVECPVAQ